MCGIFGAIGHYDEQKLKAGLQAIAHRGPDGFGVWQDDDAHVFLGHRRLSILDLSEAGKQPMMYHNLVITFNGEIYNYLEVRRVLEGRGHRFVTGTDTEVILHAFQEWGASCVEHFNGMWAFAIWDKEKKSLFLSRDRFGVKPLFYAWTKNGVVFGSEMKALTPVLDAIEISADFFWCRDHIYEYESLEKSLISGIVRFPAGHNGTIQAGEKRIELKRYWNTLEHIENNRDSYEVQVEKFRELFFDACRLRMRSDVPIGTALSGGLDSSAVAAAMKYNAGMFQREIKPGWQNAFVATFRGTELDETEYAQSVVDSLGLRGFFNEIDPAKGFENLHQALWYFEELYLTSPIPMMEIYRSIKSNGITVSLDGHGADELFSGYGTTLFHAVRDNAFDRKSIREIIQTYKQMRGVDKSNWDVLVDGFAGRKNLLSFYLKRLLRQDHEGVEIVKRLGHFNGALYQEFHQFILPTLLRNYDRYSMANSVEVRMPFMDYRLVSFCFSIPWTSKLRGGYTKAILRDAIEPFLPAKVVRRKSKTGFATPLTQWFEGAWKIPVRDTVESTSFRNSSVIDPVVAQRAVNEFYSKNTRTANDGLELWKVLMPYFWENSFFKNLKTNL